MKQYGPVGDFPGTSSNAASSSTITYLKTDFPPVKDKIVAITGGGSGIGLAFARACHAKGARIVIADLKLTKDGEDFIATAGDAAVAFRKCDVTNWTDLHDVISTSVDKFHAVPDVYAPVAGIYEPAFSNFWDDEEDGYKTLRINVEHPIKFARLAMRALAGAEKQGVVVMVSSTAGIRATYLASLYTASKHAVVGFTKAMGQADPDLGVRINCIMPGMVSSPLWHDRDDGMKDWGHFKDRKGLETSDIGECMVRMVEEGRFEGGTCVLKTAYEEKVQEDGHSVLKARYKEYDPSPRPEPDLTRITKALAKERGKPWT